MSETAFPLSFPVATGEAMPSRRRTWSQIAALLIVVGLASGAIGWSMFPFTSAYTRVKLDDAGLASATIDRLIATSARWRPLTFVTTPVVETIKIALIGALLFGIQLLADAEIPYVVALWIACWMEVVGTLRRATSLLVLALRGTGAIRHASDLAPPLGLDLFVRSDSGIVAHTLASFINPFDLLVAWFLFWTASRTTKTRGGAAYVTCTVMCTLFAARALLFKLSAA